MFLKLKLAVEQVKDLEQVHSAITFSCYFTLAEIEGRWRHLLTETDIAAAAASEISALSLNAFQRAVEESCLFSEEESEILMNVTLRCFVLYPNLKLVDRKLASSRIPRSIFSPSFYKRMLPVSTAVARQRHSTSNGNCFINIDCSPTSK